MADRRKLRELFKSQKQLCFYCKKQVHLGKNGTPGRATLDHYIPKSRGGTSASHNLVMACYACNNAKADWFPWEWEKIKASLSEQVEDADLKSASQSVPVRVRQDAPQPSPYDKLYRAWDRFDNRLTFPEGEK